MSEALQAPQRVAALVGLPALLKEHGVPLSRLTEGLPIDSRVFDDAETRLPYGMIAHILEKAARLANCPHLGLQLGSRFDHMSIGAVGKLMEQAPDLGTAFNDFILLQGTSTRGGSAYVQRRDGCVVFGYGAYNRHSVEHGQLYQTVVAIGFNLIRKLTAGRARPQEILFSIRKPKDVAPFRALFGVPVNFNQTQSGILVPHNALSEPIAGADPRVYRQLKDHIATLMPSTGAVWSDEVRHNIRQGLANGDFGESFVAERMGVHPKTLVRRLLAEGASFRALLTEVRLSVAKELLAITDLPAGEIAYAVGYANQSAFTQAFRQSLGVTPSVWKAGYLQEPGRAEAPSGDRR